MKSSVVNKNSPKLDPKFTTLKRSNIIHAIIFTLMPHLIDNLQVANRRKITLIGNALPLDMNFECWDLYNSVMTASVLSISSQHQFFGFFFLFLGRFDDAAAICCYCYE